MTQKTRLAIVVSHPIQYYVPLYRALAREPSLDVHVIFASRIGLRATLDRDMGVAVAWATDLIGGYSHEFLPEADSIRQAGFRGINNPSIAGALRRFGPDAVILHGYASLTLLRALFWSRTHGVEALLISDSSSHGAPPGPRRWLKSLVLPPLLEQFAAALTMGDSNERHLASLGYPRSRMFRTPMMIDESFWRARRQRPAIRARRREGLGLREDEFTALYAGKLHPRKRAADILNALPRLRDQGARTTLLIAGDGEQREALQALAAERQISAHFLGFVNIDALPDVYATADALVHPAGIEQYGMVVLEAAVVGLPLILSDRIGAIGASSIARPDVNALVYPVGDIDALGHAIARLRDDAALRRRMSEASEAISAEHDGAASVAAVVRAVAR